MQLLAKSKMISLRSLLERSFNLVIVGILINTQHFVRVRYFVVVTTGLVVPADPADFAKFTDNSKHPIVLTLPAAQAGMPIAISSCYVDAQGNEGPYSNVVTLNIS